MKRIFLLSLAFFGNLKSCELKSCEIESAHGERLFSPDIKEVQEAINDHIDIDSKNKWGATALMFAIMKDRLKIAELLIHSRADTELQNNDYANTPLLLAVKNDRLEIAKLLIAAGANLNTADKDGYTPLMIAAKNNQIEIAKLLIDAGANINIQKSNGSTALAIAEFLNNRDVVKLIKEQIVCLELNFIKAAQEGKIRELTQMIEQGININAQDENGFTALMRASQAFLWLTPPYSKEIKDELQRKLEIVKILLDKKADLSLKDNVMHYTALQWSRESGNTQAEKLLEAAGATE